VIRNAEAWTSLVAYLGREAPTFVQLQRDDLEDGISYVLEKFIDLAQSFEAKDRQLAMAITTQPKLKYIWARSRFRDYVRKLRGRDSTSLESAKGLDTLIDESVKSDFESVTQRDAIRSALQSARSRLTPVELEALEIIVTAELTGRTEKSIVEEQGNSYKAFAATKSRLRSKLISLGDEVS